MNPPIVAPSLLAGNHAALAESNRIIVEHGLTWVHLDIMDGHFVPNLSFGPQTVADLRPTCDLFFDTHLMLDNPDLYVEAFAKAGADRLTIHIEPDYPIEETLVKIKSLGLSCGLALNPATPAETLLPYLEQVDLVLCMTVQPGFGGQAFDATVLPKIARFDSWRKERGLHYRIEVDGGVDAHTGRQCRDHGADTFVCGTAYFKAPDRDAFVADLTC
jgi:ribulose-phosphate 3-epimerase